jgi:RHS repeat-associated protein
VPDPETTAPASTPDKSTGPYGVKAADEAKMKRWDEPRLDGEFRSFVQDLASYGLDIPPYVSPTGDGDFEKRVNRIIDDERAKLDAAGGSAMPQNRVVATPDGPAKAAENASQNVAKGADPVNLANGELVYSATDLRLDGAGIGFAFVRTYSQLPFYNGPLGFNWDHSFNLWLRMSPDGSTLKRSTGEVREEKFIRHEMHGYWLPLEGGRGVFVKTAASFTHRLPDGTRVVYQPHPTFGPPLHVAERIVDRFGNALVFSYDEDRLARVEVNHSQRTVDFTYDSLDRIIEVRDFTARTWRYSYDDLGDLVAVTTPATDDHPAGTTVSYSYSTALQSDPALQHMLTEVLDADGRLFLENQYGQTQGLASYRRVVRQRQGGGDFVFDYADVVELFERDYEEHEQPASQTVVTGRDGRQLGYLFNRLGQMLLREEYARVDGIPRVVAWHYRYNADGALIGALSPRGRMTQALFGRDMYERRFPPGPDYRPETDAGLTLEERLKFDHLLAVVRRGRAHDLNALNLAIGLWSTQLMPDILTADAEDVVQKFTYEPEFAQPLTVSDPRYTQSADPMHPEDGEYDRRLTRFNYEPGGGYQNLLLTSIQLPTPTLPDGTTGGPVVTRFTDYDARGRKLRVVQSNGLVAMNLYASASEGLREGYLKTTTLDPGGLNIVTGAERDDLGRPVRLMRPPFFDLADGRYATSLEFDALDRVVRTTATPPFSFGVRHRYARSGALARSELELKDEANAAAGVFVTDNHYDDELHLVRQTTGDAIGSHSRQVKSVFDQAGRPTLQISPEGCKRKTGYDERSLAAKTIEDYGGSHAVTRTLRDADGLVSRVIDPRGGVTRYTYDVLGRLVDVEDALGGRTLRAFDKVGALVLERRFEKAGPGAYRLLARHEFGYDELGRLISAAANRFDQPPPGVAEAELDEAFSAAGPGQLLTVQNFYDVAGNMVRQVDRGDRVWLAEFDLLGRVARRADPNGNEERFQYDKEGALLRFDRTELTRDPVSDAVTATRCFAESYVYDELGRPTERRGQTGAEQRSYDSRGAIVETRNPLGDLVRSRIDVFGRTIETERPLGRREPGETLAPVRTSFTFDRDDRLTSQTDALGRVTRFAYDTAGRLVATMLPDDSADASIYDRVGNLVRHRSRNGLLQHLQWDALNRRTGLEVDSSSLAPGAAFAGATVFRTTYDGIGRAVRLENDFAVNEVGYDSLGRAITETTTFTAATGSDPSRQYVLTRDFTNTALVSLTYPSGRVLRYERDRLDRVIEVRQTARGFDYPGDPGTPDTVQLMTIRYEGLQQAGAERPGGLTSAVAYDFAGRAVELRHANGAGPILIQQRLHDSAGFLRQRIETSADFQGSSDFRYDTLMRLIEAKDATAATLLEVASVAPPPTPPPEHLPDRQGEIDALMSAPAAQHSRRIDYDLVGNRIAVATDGTFETYQSNILDQYDSVDGQGLRHDLEGSLVEEGAFRYAYDHQGLLTQIVRKSDGRQLDVIRDAVGRPCVQRQGSSVEITLYDGLNPVEQYGDAQLKRSVAFDGRHDGLIASASGGAELQLLTDLEGSVRFVFDRLGRQNFYVYDPFGALTSALITAGDENVFRFASKREFADTGKYDFVNRVYDPERGRFLQRDPKSYVDGSNLYVFARNNPFMFRDPDGTETRAEQSIDAGLHGFRAGMTPLDRAGKPLMGTYNLWSDMRPGMGLDKARAAPGWIMEQTPQHAEAEVLDAAYKAAHPNQQMPQDVFDDIWVARSEFVARKATLSGKPVASWGLDTHPNPSATVQTKYELPTVRRWGAGSGGLMTLGGLMNTVAAINVDNTAVKVVGVTAGPIEATGGVLYGAGAITQDAWLMSVGGTMSRYAGGIGLTVVGGYTFYNDVRAGNARNAIGSGANTTAGASMLLTSNPWVLTATGTFAVSYNGSKWVRDRTGWGDTSASVGGWAANGIMGDDPGMIRTGIGWGVGLVITAGGTLFVEPVGYGVKKIAQGASWSYDKITDAIGYEFYWPF